MELYVINLHLHGTFFGHESSEGDDKTSTENEIYINLTNFSTAWPEPRNELYSLKAGLHYFLTSLIQIARQSCGELCCNEQSLFFKDYLPCSWVVGTPNRGMK
jgi:hypothetical protein